MNIPNPKFEIVCAGIPRSGSTMLYRALMGLPPGSTTPSPQVGPILKTHSFRPREFVGMRAAVFIFGDPIDAIVSTRMRRWVKGHFVNCGAGDLDLEAVDIFREDILNYEAMFDAWMRRQSFDTVCVRYERLHENADIIAGFLNQPLVLPPHKHRADYSTQICAEDLAAARITYKKLIRKIERAPDVSIWRKK